MFYIIKRFFKIIVFRIGYLKKPLRSNFNEVLRAFFLVAFIGNIHYPEAGESVPILLDSPEAIWVIKKMFGSCVAH
jgi:hypothetical protein